MSGINVHLFVESILLNLGKLLGCIPWKNKIHSKIYSIIISGAIIALLVYSALQRFSSVRSKYLYYETFMVLDYSELVFASLMVIIYTFFTNKYREICAQFTHLCFQSAGRNLKSHFRNLFVPCAIYISLQTFVLAMVEKKFFKTHSIFLLEFLYEFYFYLQIVSVLRSIHQAYEDLDGLIKKNCNIMSNGLTKELIKMERIIRVNENYVADFNTIFGWPLFLFLCSSLTKVLVYINASLVQYYSTKFTFDLTKSLTHCVFALVYLTSLLVIVNLCDKIEKATDKVAKLCYSYQENFAAFANVREELFILARCSKNHKPSFTAGFYTFNRPTLVGLLAGTISYTIIIVQFNINKN